MNSSSARREFKGGIVASVRYIDRRLKRVIEDQSGSFRRAEQCGLPSVLRHRQPDRETGHLREPNELVFDQGVNFNILAPRDGGAGQPPCDQLPSMQPTQQLTWQRVPLGLRRQERRSQPFVAFNQFSGFAGRYPGAVTNGSACFPASTRVPGASPPRL